jgi:hypothetical protein
MEYINEVYRNFPIRDQDDDVRRVSDLLQAWGAPAREPFRSLVRRNVRKPAAAGLRKRSRRVADRGLSDERWLMVLSFAGIFNPHDYPGLDPTTRDALISLPGGSETRGPSPFTQHGLAAIACEGAVLPLLGLSSSRSAQRQRPVGG